MQAVSKLKDQTLLVCSMSKNKKKVFLSRVNINSEMLLSRYAQKKKVYLIFYFKMPFPVFDARLNSTPLSPAFNTTFISKFDRLSLKQPVYRILYE